MMRQRPWVTDAIDLDIPEKLEVFRESLFHETYPIATFMGISQKDRDSKFLIIAPKGYGKTLLLKSKRVSMGISHRDHVFLPHDELIDRPSGTPPIFSKEGADRKWIDLQYWTDIWRMSICLSVLQNINKEYLGHIDCDYTKSLLNTPVYKTPTDIFNEILHFSDGQYFRTSAACASSMVAFFRSIRRPAAIFIDNIDDYFSPQIHGNLDNAAIYRNTDRRMWVLAQVGLAEAIRELRAINAHIKVFAALRKEAMDRSFEITPNALQLLGISVELKYSKDELYQMFVKNIKYEHRNRLSDPRASDDVAKFVGQESMLVRHRFTGKSEQLFDFVSRHSLGRPRDLMFIGQAISNINPPRKFEDIREAVFVGAKNAVLQHFKDMEPFIFVPNEYIFKLINKNVLTRKELSRIASKYNKYMTDRQYYTNGHPFCAMYRMGLLGILSVETTSPHILQKFQNPDFFRLAKDEGILPEKTKFLIHPALDELIADHHGPEYRMNFERNNIIGDGLTWDKSKSNKYVLKGDIVGYSDIMDSREYAGIYPGLFEDWVEEASSGLEYSDISGGDSVLLIDGSPTKLILAAQRLAQRVREFENFSREMRFGATGGTVEFRRTASRKLKPDGLVLRTSARLEPVAPVGTILADERFAHGAMEFNLEGKYIHQMIDGDIAGLSSENDKFIISKKPGDPTIVTKLWSINLKERL